MANASSRGLIARQNPTSAAPIVDPSLAYPRQQLQLQQQRLQHGQNENQSNQQLLTPQSGTVQPSLPTVFPHSASEGPLEESSKRSLPPTDITDENLDGRYVQFILYCNPAIPDGVDATALKAGLRSPPRSDGKTYSPFVIFRLISRLENKEIKSWTSLVVEMGVELPDTSKNQSTQKVQQYAVRLKVGSTSPFILIYISTILDYIVR